MITALKLNNSIVFSRAIFWGPRTDEIGAEDQRAEGRAAEDKDRGLRVEVIMKIHTKNVQ